MDKGLVDLAELRKRKDKANFNGKSAYCFIYGNKIIKVYSTDNKDCYFCLDFDKICDFSMFKADTIVFPEAYLYEDNHKAGEIQKFIKDESIMTSFNNSTDINLLIKHYEKVLNDLMTFININMLDLCACNILYSDKKGFHIIDTTEWQLTKDNAMRRNIFYFNRAIVSEILDLVGMPTIYGLYYNSDIEKNIVHNTHKYGKVGKEFNHVLECNLNEHYHVLDLIYLYMRLYEKHYDKKMHTLGDMENYTKILKKG